MATRPGQAAAAARQALRAARAGSARLAPLLLPLLHLLAAPPHHSPPFPRASHADALPSFSRGPLLLGCMPASRAHGASRAHAAPVAASTHAAHPWTCSLPSSRPLDHRRTCARPAAVALPNHSCIYSAARARCRCGCRGTYLCDSSWRSVAGPSSGSPVPIQRLRHCRGARPLQLPPAPQSDTQAAGGCLAALLPHLRCGAVRCAPCNIGASGIRPPMSLRELLNPCAMAKHSTNDGCKTQKSRRLQALGLAGAHFRATMRSRGRGKECTWQRMSRALGWRGCQPGTHHFIARRPRPRPRASAAAQSLQRRARVRRR